jgi:hypothetical protein
VVDMHAEAITDRIGQMSSESSRDGRKWRVVEMTPDSVSARIAVLAAASDLCHALVQLGREATRVIKPAATRSE